MFRTPLALIFTVLLSHSSISQEYGDPEFYILDSIRIDNITEDTRTLLDTSLERYHQTEDKVDQLWILQDLVTYCWNEKIWPRYNAYIGERIAEQSLIPGSEKHEGDYKEMLANVLSNKGFHADQNGDFKEALNYYHQALDLQREVQSYKDMSATLNNIAVIHSVIAQYDKAYEYQEQSRQCKILAGDSSGLAVTYINMGNSLENQKEYKRAMDLYQEALSIATRFDIKRSIAKAHDKIGDIHMKHSEMEMAVESYRTARGLWEEVDSRVGIAGSGNNLATALYAMGKYREAREYAEESYKISKDLGYPVDIQNTSKTMSLIVREEGDYKKALDYFDEYVTMREVLRNDQSDKELYQKSMDYEYERIALQDSLEFVKKEEVNRQKIKTQRVENYALYGGLGLTIILLFIGYRSFVQKKKDNALIKEQKEEVETQKQEIETAHVQLGEHMKEIADSISYAKRIQDAILPSNSLLNEYLVDGFVMFRPRDIVSGDFYWFEKSGEDLYFGVADCTGHGVPGAMVSVVCNNALKRSIREYGLNSPASILQKSREIIIEGFQAEDHTVQDGMDISLCKLNKAEGTLEWAGANNPLLIVRAKDLTLDIVMADKQPVGWYNVDRDFNNHAVEFSKGDMIYMFSDGYPDQFGGEKGKKLNKSRFHEIIVRGANYEPEQQQQLLEEFFEEWIGDFDQIDDVCVMGVRL